MHIEVKKITRELKKDRSGSIITIPDTNKGKLGNIKVEREIIRLDQIRSARIWNKNEEEIELLESPITVIYMISSKEDKKAPEIHVAESFESLINRIGATPAP